ncbi:Calcipressin-domain-containing protein [Kockiozyma suomiensis]|uniref:Calcipressin-domain-containing protein n=1 Tax=Kockiozyma suomiensis TaxID=1337062 RepID=UPI0033432471
MSTILERRRPAAVSPSLSISPSSTSSPPSLAAAVPLSNTVVLTGLYSARDFSPASLSLLREVAAEAIADEDGEIVHWGPLPTFGRIVVVCSTVSAALRIRVALDYTHEPRSLIRVFFGQHTPLEPLLARQSGGDVPDIHLRLPDQGKLYLISPPPSPPAGWESTEEEPPNTKVGVPADVLASVLAKLSSVQLQPQQRQQDLPRLDISDLADSQDYGLSTATSMDTGSFPHSPSVVIMEADELMPGIVVSDHSDTYEFLPFGRGSLPKTKMPFY